MKKFKLLAIAVLVGTSFIAGQMFAPNAKVAEPGSSDDPAVAESLLNQELGKLKTEITTLKTKVTSLEKTVDSLESGGSNSGGSNNGGSNNGGSNNGGSTASIGTAIVNTPSLNVRSGAGTSYSKVGTITSGAKVTLLKKSGSWYQIKYNSITGWVSGDYLKVTLNSSGGGSSSTSKTGTVNAVSLNVRSGAGTSYSKIGALTKGTKVTILKTSGTWMQVKAGSITGWVSAEYIKVNK